MHSNSLTYCVLIVAILAGSAGVSAQSASSILKQAEKALGGAKALKNVTSVTRRGTIRRLSDGAEGEYAYQTARPVLYNLSFDLDGFETELGYNGRSGWARNSRDGLRTVTGKASTDFQARAAFANLLWLDAGDQKAKVTSGGRANIDGRPANVVIFTTQKGVAIRLAFDAVSGLPVRVDIPNGEQTDSYVYDDYRPVAGIRMPFREVMTYGGETYEIRIGEARTNQPIARSEFDFPAVAGEPLPDIPSLLKEISANQTRIEAMLESYSFTQTISERELTREGILREKGSETFQMSFYKGNRIRRLIEKNGKPLSPKDQADADKDAEKQVEEIEKRLAKEESQISKMAEKGVRTEDNRRISIAELLAASKLINPRRERFRGRDVVVFDFEPNPAFDMKNAKSMLRFFGKTAGVMWVDEKDRQIARIESVLYESYKVGGGILAKLHRGASFTLEQERVNDEIWLPSRTEINGSVRVLLFKGLNINQLITSYGYRKFETEVKDARVDDVKKP